MAFKVNQLPKDANLSKVKVRLPPDILKQYQEYCGGEPEMWIGGPLMGDWFLSPHPPDTKGERKLFPMPEHIYPQQILEWEVVEIYGLSSVELIFDMDELKK